MSTNEPARVYTQAEIHQIGEPLLRALQLKLHAQTLLAEGRHLQKLARSVAGVDAPAENRRAWLKWQREHIDDLLALAEHNSGTKAVQA